MLTPENYKNGFLIDQEWMASINESDGVFQAFVVNHSNAEVIAAREFDSLDAAIQAVNTIPRQWVYESASSCGGCSKNEANGGSCPAGGVCKKGSTQSLRSTRQTGVDQSSSCSSQGKC